MLCPNGVIEREAPHFKRELSGGSMSPTFVGNGLVFPSGIWYEDPEKRIEVSECKKRSDDM